MVMRDIASFWFPETRSISRGEAEGNRPGQGEPETCYIPHNHTLTVLLYRYILETNEGVSHFLDPSREGVSNFFLGLSTERKFLGK